MDALENCPTILKGLCCWHVSKNEGSWVSVNNISTTTHIMVEWSNHLLLMCSMLYLVGSKSQDNKPPRSWKTIWIEFWVSTTTSKLLINSMEQGHSWFII
jgi:hypothetical protein